MFRRPGSGIQRRKGFRGIRDTEPAFPESISGLTMDLDAEIGIGLVGGKVDTWIDATVHGNDASAPLAANRAGFTANDPNFNGHASVNFDGSAQYLTVADADTIDITANGISIYVVALAATPGAGNYTILGKWVTTFDYLIRIASTTGELDTFVRNGANLANYAASSAGFGGGGATVCAMRFVDGSLGVRLDSGTETTDTTQTGYLATAAALGIGALSDGSQPTACDIARVLLYSRQLSDAEDTALRLHLIAKYGVT